MRWRSSLSTFFLMPLANQDAPTDDGEAGGDIKDDCDQSEHGKDELLSENS